MIQRLVTHIGGIAGFGTISIILFFAVFAGALGCAWLLKRPFLDSMASLPLLDEKPAQDEKGESSHE